MFFFGDNITTGHNQMTASQQLQGAIVIVAYVRLVNAAAAAA